MESPFYDLDPEPETIPHLLGRVFANLWLIDDIRARQRLDQIVMRPSYLPSMIGRAKIEHQRPANRVRFQRIDSLMRCLEKRTLRTCVWDQKIKKPRPYRLQLQQEHILEAWGTGPMSSQDKKQFMRGFGDEACALQDEEVGYVRER